MNTPATLTAVAPARSLAICGWTPEAIEALDALESTGAYRAIGIADGSGAALVRARQETGHPCFQQVRQWMASAPYEAVLIASPQSAEFISLAARRGADLLLLPGASDVETLEAAVEAAQRHDVRIALLRPESHDAGVGDLACILDTPEWAPHYLDVTVEGPAAADRLLGTAVVHAVRFAPTSHGLVRASAWTGGTESPRVVSALLEADATQVHLTARHAPEAYVRITGDTPAGAFDLRIAADNARLTYTTPSGERIEYEPGWVDHWQAEAYRAVEADDAARAREEAGLLAAIARSVLTGEAQATDCCTRPELRVIEGRGHARPRRGNLRLVVS